VLGELPPEAERGESSAAGGYPALADRELLSPDEPVDGAEVEGVSVDGDDGMLHTESRELDPLDE
jgi:hypothetical protein